MCLYPNEHETIEGVGQALRAGRTTCVEVLEKCLDRIEEWEARIRAWVRVDRPGAIERARALDEELAVGRCRGPLHGIPVGIKDIIDVAGLSTAAGFEPWAGRVAGRDCPIVAGLRAAGAVILGKTVTTQFAWVDPPPTKNPWALDRTPGGSSSGSAAAVALGMCLGAIGTQTGGSIIRPASYCGVAGLKPGHGDHDRDELEGIVPFAPHLDHPGPIARSVDGLALLFSEFRRDRRDGAAGHDHWPTEAVSSMVERLVGDGGGPPRLGRVRGFFEDRADSAMRAEFDRAHAALADAGARVGEALLPFDVPEVLRNHRVIMAFEAAEGHGRRPEEFPDAYQPRILDLLREGRTISSSEYARCRLHQRLLRGAIEVLSDDEPRPCRRDPNEVEVTRASIDASFSARMREAIEVLMSGFDALVMPATIGPAPDASTTGDPAFNSPWSYLGSPAVSFPIGLSPEGLPLALQMVALGTGRGESDLLATARWCEGVIRRAYRPRSQRPT